MMDHQSRGLTYVALDLNQLQSYVFVARSFANNQDLSSQIGYLIVLDDDSFLTGNILHFSSTKSRRVTRSVLASEILGMVAGVDLAIAMTATPKQITIQLDLP